MKNLNLLLLILSCNFIFSHTINSDNSNLRLWKLQKENKIIEGSFSMLKNNSIYIEDAHNNLIHFPISSFVKADQDFANEKIIIL